MLAAGEATVIGEVQELDVRSWEMDGSGRVREALQFHTQRVTGENAR